MLQTQVMCRPINQQELVRQGGLPSALSQGPASLMERVGWWDLSPTQGEHRHLEEGQSVCCAKRA